MRSSDSRKWNRNPEARELLYRLLVSKKSKKHIAERHPHLEKSYPGVSSDTTRISDIKEREGLHKRFCT
ncbi:unnamed protein product [Rhizophagus irregularis]|nr:unnamed protein product [Rhizophagus irregularis]